MTFNKIKKEFRNLKKIHFKFYDLTKVCYSENSPKLGNIFGISSHW